MCVSTAIVGQPNAVFNTTLAVCGNCAGQELQSTSTIFGTSPLCCSSKIRQVLMIFSAAVIANRFDIGFHPFNASSSIAAGVFATRVGFRRRLINTDIGRLSGKQYWQSAIQRKRALSSVVGISCSRRRVRISGVLLCSSDIPVSPFGNAFGSCFSTALFHSFNQVFSCQHQIQANKCTWAASPAGKSDIDTTRNTFCPALAHLHRQTMCHCDNFA